MQIKLTIIIKYLKVRDGILATCTLLSSALTKRAVVQFGEFLIKKGLITDTELDLASNLAVSKLFFGVLSVREEYLELDSLGNLLEEQKTIKQHKKIGQIAVSKGLMNQEQVEKILAIQRESEGFLGEIFASMGVIDSRELEKQLEAYRAEYGDNE